MMVSIDHLPVGTAENERVSQGLEKEGLKGKIQGTFKQETRNSRLFEEEKLVPL